MRTTDQIKRKLHELTSQKQALETPLSQSDDPAANREAQARIDRLEDQIILLEWELNEPLSRLNVIKGRGCPKSLTTSAGKSRCCGNLVLYRTSSVRL
jgi:hypothetical protein